MTTVTGMLRPLTARPPCASIAGEKYGRYSGIDGSTACARLRLSGTGRPHVDHSNEFPGVSKCASDADELVFASTPLGLDKLSGGGLRVEAAVGYGIDELLQTAIPFRGPQYLVQELTARRRQELVAGLRAAIAAQLA
jgi:hypothetical protein